MAIAFASTMTPVLAADDTAPSNALRIGSGPEGKVYQLLVRDMQAVCGNEVPIVNVSSVGGIPNLMALSASQIDLGIAQLDTFREIARDGDESVQTLQAVMPLHINLLHILSLKEGSKTSQSVWNTFDKPSIFSRFSELKGATIAVVGSTMLLGQRLNAQLGYGMDLRRAETDDDAVKLLRENKVQAVFTDGGWPLPTISRHKADSGLQLVQYDLPAQPPFSVVKRTYQDLDAFKMPFLGSPNLLLTRPFNPNGELGKRVAALQSCLLRHLEELQEGHYHPAWKEIRNPLDTLGVTRFAKSAKAK